MAVLCRSCRQLVGTDDATCYNCGRRRPGRAGIGAFVTGTIDADTFVALVLWACGALYLCTLAVDVNGVSFDGPFSFLGPSGQAAALFGASGAVPIFQLGRWWTPLSASWLHGGLLHIVFNMLWMRDLAPAVAELYGASRLVIIYVVAGVVGFLSSSVAFLVLGGIPYLGGSRWTLGASASVFGLLGALLVYSRRGGSGLMQQQVRSWLLGGLLFGFVMPGVDNWAHLGGFAGGYACAQLLGPLRPERPVHGTIAVVCLLASLAAVLASVVTLLPYFHR
jgi:rhomboid protease GluP